MRHCFLFSSYLFVSCVHVSMAEYCSRVLGINHTCFSLNSSGIRATPVQIYTYALFHRHVSCSSHLRHSVLVGGLLQGEYVVG